MIFKKKKPYVPRIPFGEWYPKLKSIEVGRVFHTIRFIDKYDYYRDLEESGTEVDIFMTPSEEIIARCRILGIAIVTIYDMDEKIVHADTYTHWTLLDLRKLFEKFYGRKQEWDGKNTRYIMLFLLPTEVAFETAWQPVYREAKETKLEDIEI